MDKNYINNLKFLNDEATKTFNLLISKMKDDDKFVFSEDCNMLINSYFSLINEIQKNKCNHEYITLSLNDCVWQECKKCGDCI